MTRGIFVIGTDTGVGKTVISAAIAAGLKAEKFNIGVMKPVQAGGTDAQFLMMAAEVKDPFDLVCPYSFKAPVSPALAAKLQKETISIEKIKSCLSILSQKHEFMLVEGAGGFHVPLKDNYLLGDLAAETGFPVVIVSRTGLGTINHTLLTIEACRQKGIEVLGIIFNQTENKPLTVIEKTNPETISKLTGVPVLGVVPYESSLRTAKGSEAIPVLRKIVKKIKINAIATPKTGVRDDRQLLKSWDKKYIWHPFTQMKDYEKEEPVIIEEGKGSYIKDIDGNWYIDGVSSLWVNVQGHRKKELDDSIKNQLNKIAHSTLLGLGNVPSIELAKKLIEIAPKGLKKVFYSDSGSTAVEIALKIAFQCCQQTGQKKKTKFISFVNAYHGDTIGSVSVGGMDLFHKVYKPMLFNTIKINAPYCYRCHLGLSYPACKLKCTQALENILKRQNQEIAGLIIEPLIQGAAGMLTQPKGYMKKVREICTKYNVLMIADEVATGFGRTGRMFACEHEKVSPDIMCVAKSITGGYLPLAATLTTGQVYNGFLADYSQQRTFFHGHTYTGNPLACAVAIANLKLYEKEKLISKLQSKINFLKNELKRFRQLGHVGDIRQQGMMVGIELSKNRKSKEDYTYAEKIGIRVINEARNHGVLLRPLGSVIVLMPPLSISKKELKTLLDAAYISIKTVTEN